jgi:hypothetical protein
MEPLERQFPERGGPDGIERFARLDRDEGLDEFGRGAILGQATESARRLGPISKVRSMLRRQDQDFDRRDHFPNPPGCFQSIECWKAHIHDDDVRLQVAGFVDRFRAVFSGTHHFKLLTVPQVETNPFPHKGVIIDHEDPRSGFHSKDFEQERNHSQNR